MPRYFFHLYNDLVVRDEEGEELPDLAAAHARAVQYARDMTATGVVEHGTINLRHRIEVTGEQGDTLLKVEFGDAFTLTAVEP